jgi:hypothetical protein
MRTLALALAFGLFAASSGAALACTGMQTAQKDQVIASSNGQAKSTPIPSRQGDGS